uniref:Uncharacterized protein n=1 Tax=Timema shepardi TaxID=629360 RepID=A0A7R9ARS1_TIMSH|nr:unnamed protein product [Timema shepardi]
MFLKIRELKVGTTGNMVFFNYKSGNLLTDGKKILDRWKEYFREILNCDDPNEKFERKEDDVEKFAKRKHTSKMKDGRLSENFKRTRPTMARFAVIIKMWTSTPVKIEDEGRKLLKPFKENLESSVSDELLHHKSHLRTSLLLLRANRPVSRLTLSLHIESNTDAQSNVLIGQESAPKPPPPLKDHKCKPQVRLPASGFSY